MSELKLMSITAVSGSMLMCHYKHWQNYKNCDSFYAPYFTIGILYYTFLLNTVVLSSYKGLLLFGKENIVYYHTACLSHKCVCSAKVRSSIICLLINVTYLL